MNEENGFCRRAITTEYAWRMVNLPYRWGGDDSIKGYDCSGEVCELLKAVGVLPNESDLTADNLMRYFKNQIIKTPQEGCLVFYGKDGIATHVAYCINGLIQIGANGGGRNDVDLQTASEDNAFIKPRLILYRSDVICYVDPFGDNDVVY